MPMRLILALIMSLPVFGQTFVQSTTCSSTGGATAHCTLTVTRGHTLVLVLGPGGFAGSTTITDTFGDSFSSVVVQGGTNNAKLEIWRGLTTGAGSNTINIANVGSQMGAIVGEYTNSFITDGTPGTVAGNSPQSISTVISASTMLAVIGTEIGLGTGTFTLTPNTGWTQRVTFNSGVSSQIALYDNTSLSVGSYSTSVSASSDPLTAGIAALKLAPLVSASAYIF